MDALKHQLRNKGLKVSGTEPALKERLGNPHCSDLKKKKMFPAKFKNKEGEDIDVVASRSPVPDGFVPFCYKPGRRVYFTKPDKLTYHPNKSSSHQRPSKSKVHPTLPLQDTRKVSKVEKKKHALLIGLNDYVKFRPLKWCEQDALEMDKALKDLDWKTTLHTNILTGKKMAEIIDKFMASVHKGDDALIYFAGHGESAKGHQVLRPTKTGSYNIGPLMQRIIDKECGVFGFILDCCRSVHGRGALTSRPSFSPPVSGTYIVYATAQGRTSDEFKHLRHGLFTHHLLNSLKDTPKKPINELFVNVRNRVVEDSKGEQAPWIAHSLSSTKYSLSSHSSVCV